MPTAFPSAGPDAVPAPPPLAGAARRGGGATGAAGYRPDVDGLRAVAVLAVVLYHAGVPGISGGFVGVDVFFVISGYLITGIVAREVAAGEFRLARFYERRARRILPALFVVVGVVAVPAAVLLVPQSLAAYGRSAAAAALSVSNISFYRSTDYFSPGAGQLPLLHTWSLGVEEQFYVVLPLYLLLLRRQLVRRPLLVIGPPVLASFVLAVLWTSSGATSEAFYLPFGRAWELGVGAALALGVLPAVRSRLLAAGLVGAGLAAVLASAVLYDDRTTFPGVAALLPVLGAAAVVHGGAVHRVGASRLLSLRPVVFVGLVSYSLYLWHWPVLVLARTVLARDLPLWLSLALLPLMFALAVLSWRFVERPFRRPRSGSGTRRPLLVATAAILAVAAAGSAVLALGGLPGRFSPAVRVLATATDDTNPERARCDSPSLERIRSGDLCVLGAPGMAPTTALVGDSFGDALSPGVVAAAEAQGRSVLVATRAGCRPLVGLTSVSPECARALDATVAEVAATPSVTTVVLVGRWSTMVEGVRLGAYSGVESYLADARTTAPGPQENRAVFSRSLARTVAALGQGKRVWVVAGVPEQEVLVPQALTTRAVLGLGPLEGVSRESYDARQASTLSLLAAGTGYDVIDVGAAACDDAQCPVVADGRSLYADDNHPSRYGAERLAPLFAPVFAG